ncbi:MAG: GH25 family lysozyme [Pseudomonadota bacterium]
MRLIVLFLFTLIIHSCTAAPQSVLDLGVAVKYPDFGDYDPVEWEHRKPTQYPVHGIDVSRWQGDIDWKTAKRGGVAFAFIKATEGGDHVDKKFMENWTNSGKAGMPRGAYHFYYFCRTAKEQADWFKRNVPKDPKALPPVIDMEWNHQSSCKYKPTAAKIRREMRSFMRMMREHYGKKPIIYTTVDFYKDNQLALIQDHEYWLRSVAGHPSQVYPGQRWSFWQYTGTGKIPGIKGETDINAFAGTPAAWRKWVEARTQ